MRKSPGWDSPYKHRLDQLVLILDQDNVLLSVSHEFVRQFYHYAYLVQAQRGLAFASEAHPKPRRPARLALSAREPC